MSIGNEFSNDNRLEEAKIGTNYEYWIIIVWLSLILLGIMFLTIE